MFHKSISKLLTCIFISLVTFCFFIEWGENVSEENIEVELEDLETLPTVQELERMCNYTNVIWCPEMVEYISQFDPKSCEPVRKIGYMKTHKTASSSLANIVSRHAIYNNLRVLLPSSGDSLFKLRLHRIAKKQNSTPWHDHYLKHNLYEFFGSHTIWDNELYRNVLGEDTKFITIIREPKSNFESKFGYTDYYEKNADRNISKYLQRIATIPNGRFEQNLDKHSFLGFNGQIKELGLKSTHLTDSKRVRAFVDKTVKDFDFVLITELFSESLVLLSEELCWPLRNMTSFRKKERRETRRQNLTKIDIDLLKRFQNPDQILYDEHNSIIHKKMQDFGASRLKRRTNVLKLLNQYVASKCNVKLEKSDPKKHAVKERRTMVVVVKSSNDECQLYGLIQSSFYEIMRQTQGLRWDKEEKDSS